ncbi:MAG: ABC transporter permease [Bdellovibrionota bacterium]
MNPFYSTLDKRNKIGPYGVYLFLIALCLIFSFLSPFFLSWDNFLNILLSSSTIGLLSIGAAFVIASAGLDLSVGSILAFSASAAAIFTSSEFAWPLMILVCLFTGSAVGFFNGFFITRLRVPAFIVTLGMLSIARGLALIITDGRPVYGLPKEIVFLGQGLIFAIPVPVWIFLIVGLSMQIVLQRTRFGVHTLCIGDNQKAVFNAGVNVKAHKVKLYILSGFLASIAGLVFMGRVNAADPSAGLMYELSAITGAILGGTHLFGGRASVVGAMLGALIMGVLQNGLTLLAIPSYYQQVAIGAVLILAVAIDRLKPEGI